MKGPIGTGTALNFRRALEATAEPRLLVLDSPGGLVAIGLLIADDVYEHKLSTFVPTGAGCYSACAFIFFAGNERQVDGELGVHQIFSDSNDLVSAQISISDILDLLGRFKTPTGVLTTMFKTPPDEMHIFTPDEIARYGINRHPGNSPTSASSAPSTPLAPSAEPAPADRVAAAETSAVKPSVAAEAPRSALQSYISRPTRLALFIGLDFFGADIAASRASDAAACAGQCLAMAGSCRAFTYNTDQRITRGPNCFLKSKRGISDGNMVAISGELLTAADPDPAPFNTGVIDPVAGVLEDIDLPGGDLARAPDRQAQSRGQCRLDCVTQDRCVAFTFVKPKHECWLKGTVGTPRLRSGMVSGVKTITTFNVAKIIPLQ
ncbi:hypothetical protein J1C48_06350 [Jiella sp. CQZ9-1]|uniref:Apple domain-containing protein n=2 Tax=Jiella flava TaxID=2816857 RepID=A0A939FZF2_9HYPH|nr:hypothetical protein [Jiella flava]